MNNSISFSTFWDNLDSHNGKYIGEYISKNGPKFLGFFLKELIDRDEISIGFMSHGKKFWATITYDPYNLEEKELSLRLDQKGEYELLFSYYDEEGEQKEYVQEINGDDLNIIPPGLKEAMLVSLETEMPSSITKNSLGRSKSKKN